MSVSVRSQIAIVWWSIGFLAIYGFAWVFLLNMMPPPDPEYSAEEIAEWYRDKDTSIRIGAMIAGWTGAFMLPIWAVVAVQVSRQEAGRKIWTFMAAMAGTMMTTFLVLGPICWGVAAFTPGRAPEVTAIMHEFGVLALVTTTQYSPFCWMAVVVVCFIPQRAPHSPFPRWFGYLNLWILMMLEAGAVAFTTRKGPFAWDGLLSFWSPTVLFGLWFAIMCYLLLKNLKLQLRDAEAGIEEEVITPQPSS